MRFPPFPAAGGTTGGTGGTICERFRIPCNVWLPNDADPNVVGLNVIVPSVGAPLSAADAKFSVAKVSVPKVLSAISYNRRAVAGGVSGDDDTILGVRQVTEYFSASASASDFPVQDRGIEPHELFSSQCPVHGLRHSTGYVACRCPDLNQD